MTSYKTEYTFSHSDTFIFLCFSNYPKPHPQVLNASNYFHMKVTVLLIGLLFNIFRSFHISVYNGLYCKSHSKSVSVSPAPPFLYHCGAADYKRDIFLNQYFLNCNYWCMYGVERTNKCLHITFSFLWFSSRI
jgi:hypothetical protein